jgi:hypothetical protein
MIQSRNYFHFSSLDLEGNLLSSHIYRSCDDNYEETYKIYFSCGNCKCTFPESLHTHLLRDKIPKYAGLSAK